ncbi:MAG: peptidyl-prolyl cis-trans isomerase [Gammaproteobacteria bacterium]
MLAPSDPNPRAAADAPPAAGRRWWHEPLLHFAVIGALLFAVHAVLAPAPPDDGRTIVVDRERLLTFLQFRLRRFADDDVGRQFDALSQSQLDALVQEYVRDEVLYREARLLGLDRDDDVIRQRLIQKVRFINRGVAAEAAVPGEDDIARHYQAHPDRYTEPAALTFAHIFFRAGDTGMPAALDRARALQQRMGNAPAAFDEGPGLGERFLYQVNYVDSGEPLLAGHFGADMARALFALPVDGRRWQGPLQSQYGAHLVMLVRHSPARLIPLAKARARVEDDLRRERAQDNERRLIDEVVAGYRVERRLAKPGASE